jgi:radical SAM protein with 4Fe4S-binding SPASM domain
VQGAFDGAGFLPLGNVMDGFDEEGLANRREYSRFDADARAKCKDCNAKSNCTGGCPATNFASTGTVHACPESDCDLQAMYIDLKGYYKAIA